MTSLYHSLRKSEGAQAARTLTRTVLGNNEGNVTKAAGILGCSRFCVRRAREGPLGDRDRTPHRQPKETKESLENLVLLERGKTGYGRRRLKKHLKAKYGLFIKEDLVGKILKRAGVKWQIYRRSKRASKPLYDYEALLPFNEGQIDTKYIEDFKALGSLAFQLRRYSIPPYQWTYVCAKTKIRFLAYSYNLGGHQGWLFMQLIALWLRLCGVETKIHLQGDNGKEFCAGSKKKEEDVNLKLRPLGTFSEASTLEKNICRALWSAVTGQMMRNCTVLIWSALETEIFF